MPEILPLIVVIALALALGVRDLRLAWHKRTVEDSILFQPRILPEADRFTRHLHQSI